MALKEYEITTPTGVKLTALFDEKTAKERGLKPVRRGAAPNAKAPANNAKAPENKARGVASASKG